MLQASALLLAFGAACQSEPATGQNYYERKIQPILTQSCARGSSGCHAADAADPFAFAAGNLDVTSFANVHKRPDLLRSFGAYPSPFLLLKAAAETAQLQIVYRGRKLPSLIPHAGGAVLGVSSEAFLTLQTWLENGATMDGVRPRPAAIMGSGPCATAVPADFDEAEVTRTSAFGEAQAEFDGVAEILNRETCNAQNCHGATQSDFYLTCGTDPRQRAWNFRQVWAFSGDPVDSSEILRRPVAGGAAHTGGAHFTGIDDPSYKTIANFVRHVGVYPAAADAGRTFFADRIMPILLQRGCAAEGCHSPAAMNDFKMRSGTQGFFSAVALEKNYRLAKDEFMAFESPDVRRGRIVAKNLFPNHGGIAHRGGPLLELLGGGGAPSSCPADDPITASPYCTFVEWARIERQGLPKQTLARIVYVEREVGGSMVPTLLDFTVHQPGADLRVAEAPLDADGLLGTASGSRSLLGSCGLDNRDRIDVRAPDVAGDGETIAFALRRDAGDTLHLWTVKIDGTDCRQLTTGAAYDFDPAWAPDRRTLVFASTRAGGRSRRFDRPQSDVWRVAVDSGRTERMTFLSNSEIGPQFMREGRVTMTTEKVDRDPQSGFYQLAGRRINWDLTDYHPLFGQRADSPVDPAHPEQKRPSIGYSQITEVREGLDGNFLAIGSEVGAPATAGAIVVFNRSVGPFEAGRGGRADPGYLASVVVHSPDGGGYRSPSQLYDGRILASWAPAESRDYDLVVVDPITHGRTILLGGPKAQLEAVLAMTYPVRGLYENRRQLVFGGSAAPADPEHAIIHFPDAPMLATLLGANLRRGRDVAGFRAADTIALLDADGALIGSAPLAPDGSAKLRVPAGLPTFLALYQGTTPLFTMSEEHQFGPGESISIGVREPMFDHVCAGCHGSVSGRELDAAVSADVLTGASESLSKGGAAAPIGP